MRELFVWYRVSRAQAREAAAVVADLQQSLGRDHPGLTARLLRRHQPPAALETWMESYAWTGHEHGVDSALEAEIEIRARVLAAWIDGERHVEAFVAVPSP